MTSPVFKWPLLVIDTETTGLPKHRFAECIEIGAVLLDRNGTEVAAFSTLVKPRSCPPETDYALEVNHISREDLEHAPSTAVRESTSRSNDVHAPGDSVDRVQRRVRQGDASPFRGHISPLVVLPHDPGHGCHGEGRGPRRALLGSEMAQTRRGGRFLQRGSRRAGPSGGDRREDGGTNCRGNGYTGGG